jgi:hypothetical protein
MGGQQNIPFTSLGFLHLFQNKMILLLSEPHGVLAAKKKKSKKKKQMEDTSQNGASRSVDLQGGGTSSSNGSPSLNVLALRVCVQIRPNISTFANRWSGHIAS